MRLGVVIAMVFLFAGVARAQNCPGGVCPVNPPASSMFVAAPAPTGAATPTAVRVEWIESRPKLFPRLAAMNDARPKILRRVLARLFWRY